jgi:hypothetical protein
MNVREMLDTVPVTPAILEKDIETTDQTAAEDTEIETG